MTVRQRKKSSEAISKTARKMPGRRLPRSYFEECARVVAPRLLGKVLALQSPDGLLAGRIVEVEAYLGPHSDTPDPAAHSFRGPTPRTTVLFGPAAHAYVYSIYGRYFCMNVTCEIDGQAGCVLLRALDPLAGFDQMARNRGLAAGAAPRELTSGPSRLCQALGLTRAAHNTLDLLDPSSPLQLRDDGYVVNEALVTVRIGINVAVDWPLRFVLPESLCVSGPKRLTGEKISLTCAEPALKEPVSNELATKKLTSSFELKPKSGSIGLKATSSLSARKPRT